MGLPQVYRDVAAVVGLARAIDIGVSVWANRSPPSQRRKRGAAGRSGYGSLYVPKRIQPDRVPTIVKLVGIEDSTKLIAAFPGEQLMFPSAISASISMRNRAIADQVREGANVKCVAACFGLTSRQIRRIAGAERNGNKF